MNTVTLVLKKIWINLGMDARFLASAPLKFRDRIPYTVRKYVSIAKNYREIDFLGRNFSYDNRLLPALLTDYLFEIDKLRRYVNFSDIHSLLDVGANVGQFAYVWKSQAPDLKVVSLEPNPEAFQLLEKNAAPFRDWRVHNFGLGAESANLDFYVVPGKSGQGSLYNSNASLGLLEQNTQRMKVQIKALDAPTLSELGRKDYDFIKIDVEGAEASVLRALAPLTWKYLYIELSESREGALSLEDALNILAKTKSKAPKVIWITKPSGPAAAYQALFHVEYAVI